MNFLVTGATGFIGRKLVSSLLREGHNVRILSRDSRKAETFFGSAVDFAAWDAAKDPFPIDALANIDSFVHLAGEGIADKRWSPRRKREIYESRIRGTRAIVSALNSMGNPPRSFICASAIGFYGDRKDEVLTEKSERGTGFLSDVCADWELEAGKTQNKVRAVQLRIGIVLGKEGGALKKLLPLFSLGLGGSIGKGRQWMSWIHVDDLVRLLIEVALNPAYLGPVNAVSPEPVTNSQFTRQLGKALGRPTLLPAPGFALKLFLGEMAAVVLSSQRLHPEVAVANEFRFTYPTLPSALSEIVARRNETELEKFQKIGKKVEDVFPFFANEKNLEAITPPWLKFNVLGKSADSLCEGCLIDYQLYLHGVRLRWQSKIIEWNEGSRFVDIQVRGPYRMWHHTHEFLGCGETTVMRDYVRYEIPRLARPWLKSFIARDIQSIFSFRCSKISERFGNPTAGV